jgi:hypothetical protein
MQQTPPPRPHRPDFEELLKRKTQQNDGVLPGMPNKPVNKEHLLWKLQGALMTTLLQPGFDRVRILLQSQPQLFANKAIPTQFTVRRLSSL